MLSLQKFIAIICDYGKLWHIRQCLLRLTADEIIFRAMKLEGERIGRAELSIYQAAFEGIFFLPS